jgi:hypothetical protein
LLLETKIIKKIKNKMKENNKKKMNKKCSAENKNQNGCSSPGYKKLNLIQTQDWRNWCSTTHLKN